MKQYGCDAAIYSINRDLWVCHSFTEDKAHRIAYCNANQCKRLIVVFCNPTYTRHQRCNYPETSIVSLFEFANTASQIIRSQYEGQIRFLQNHMNAPEKLDINSILDEITKPTKDIYDIHKSDLMEALSIIKIPPKNDSDLFHFLCATNIINAFLTRKRGENLTYKQNELFKDMYSFKRYLADVITERINNHDFSVPFFIKGNFMIIEMFHFQFSFHNVPLNEILKEFEKSNHNKEIVWSGKRMQPIAPLLLKYSRALRQSGPL